jgi:transposase
LEQAQEKVEEFNKLLEELPEGIPIVYLDESGIKQEVIREYGYAKRGEEVFGKISGKRTKKLNMIAALCDDEIIAPCIYENNMNTALFNTYLQIILLPLLAIGTVIIMDNARYHISKETRKLIEEKGCKLIYLAPYSPELNKIENYWAIIKRYVKKYLPYFPTLKDTLSFIFNFLFSSYIFISL